MIYLDNAAIHKPKTEVIQTVVDVLNNNWANASSIYEVGLESARIVQNTKEIIAKEINCDLDEIILTGSGSESNALAIDGFLKANGERKFICSTIEHSSILDNPKAKRIIFCDDQGFYKMNWIKEIKDSFVSLQMANSEIGTIQNIKEITKFLHKNNCIVHTDAVAAFGKIPIDVKDLDIDMMTATGQKIGGVCGAAFLYVKKGIKLSSIIYGTQNDGLRGGTYNTAAIAGFGKAISLIDHNEGKEINNKRNYLLDKLLYIDGITLNGSKDMNNRLPNNINICIHDTELDSQQLIAMLDMFGYCCSAGSACHSGSAEPSHVLMAIGMNKEDALRSIRITISEDNTYEELDDFYNDLKNLIEQFKIK